MKQRFFQQCHYHYLPLIVLEATQQNLIHHMLTYSLMYLLAKSHWHKYNEYSQINDTLFRCGNNGDGYCNVCARDY